MIAPVVLGDLRRQTRQLLCRLLVGQLGNRHLGNGHDGNSGLETVGDD